MEERFKPRKRKKKRIVFIIAGIALICMIYRLWIVNKNTVKMAISYIEAKRLVRKDDYYIIYQKKGFLEEGTTAYCYDGVNRSPVILVGRNPLNMYGNHGNPAIFCGEAGNKFLVKGKKITQYKNIDKTVIDVDEWEIIAPVKRAYADEYDHRYLYPVNCIDEYDVERGDYIPDTVGNQVLYPWEVDYYLKNEEDCYLITSQTEGGVAYWYLCPEGIPGREELLTDRVELTGNFPKEQYKKILGEETSGSQHYRNYILVKGKYQNNSIQIEEWKLANTIYRNGEEGDRQHSFYFLDERDYQE